MTSSIPKDVNIQRQLTNAHVNEWLKEDVFHLKWWLLIVLIVVLLVMWLIMLDKSRLQGICLFAVLTTIIFIGVNEYGEELTLWDYPVDVIAIFPSLSSINLFSLPLIYSQIYQRFTKKKFIYAVIITSAIICFVIEPFLSLAGFYHLIHWKYYFSFPIYVISVICAKFITDKIIGITNRTKSELQ